MPKVIDSAQRRQRVFEAVFDVTLEAGIEQASLRRVADAAGLAVGSVRHYFASHDALMRAAATEVIDRISARLERHRCRLATAEDRFAVAEDMLCELLPLEAHTSREVAVWLEIVAAARTNPTLREAAQRLFSGTHALARLIVDRSGVCPQHLVEIEGQRLAALIDGLALRGTLHETGLPALTSRAVVRRHLEQLRHGSAGDP